MIWSRAARFPPLRERGAALVIVSFIMAILLVGGLAAVAITSGELASSRGYRSRQVTQACAQAGLEHVRAALVDTPADEIEIEETLGPVTYRTAHYGGLASTVTELSASSYDSAGLYDGENVTNAISGGGSGGVQVLAVTTQCSGSGFGEREMQMVFRYGTPMADR